MLDKCLHITDKATGEVTKELRVCSNVTLNNDKSCLESILALSPDEEIISEKHKLIENYRFFKDKIDRWSGMKNSPEIVKNLIETLLYNVVLLPIQCGDQDAALTLFDTINNRGLQLSDMDIFKAKLYSNVDEDKRKEFMQEWDGVEDHEELFRVLMPIFRAQDDYSGKEIGIRVFFTKKNKKNAILINDYKGIMKSLKVLHAINEWIHNWYGEISSLWMIMLTHPIKQFWNSPLITSAILFLA